MTQDNILDLVPTKRDIHVDKKCEIKVKLLDFVKADDKGQVLVKLPKVYFEKYDPKATNHYIFSTNDLDAHSFTAQDENDLYGLIDYIITYYIISPNVQATLSLDIDMGYDEAGYQMITTVQDRVKHAYINYHNAQTIDIAQQGL